ncbi:MAG TPA: KH domain-containing protein [Elusimicrobiales bacterium]|nr:KH domain-containing protein [Elusimicrobiales bacterium]
MKNLAVFLLTSLVEKPDQVKVSESKEGNVVNLKATVAESDRGKVIGREGKIIKAIRTVISAASLKQNVKVFLKIE